MNKTNDHLNCLRTADFRVCCIARILARRSRTTCRSADWEVGDTAGSETGGTGKSPSMSDGFARSWNGLILLIGLLGLLLAGKSIAAEISMPEAQVKALFLINFTKYVDWPATAFTETNSPILLGVYGEGRIGDALKIAVEGKVTSGRRMTVVTGRSPQDMEKCHILFVTESEKTRLEEILSKVKSSPVLTVGESDQFLEAGGMINFLRKDGRIRLAINLEAARRAHLEISSKLLNVADSVKGSAR